MTEWQKRVVEERDGLSGKVYCLQEFIHGKAFVSVSPAERFRLYMQLTVMRQYLVILNDRIDNFSAYGDFSAAVVNDVHGTSKQV